MFWGFYDGREYLKRLSNKNGSVTVIGEIEFKAFSNLGIKITIVCLSVRPYQKFLCDASQMQKNKFVGCQ